MNADHLLFRTESHIHLSACTSLFPTINIRNDLCLP
jgi:hypothetical protein